MKRNAIIIIFFLISLPVLTNAQDSLNIESSPVKHVQVDFKVGFLNNQHTSLNNALASNGWGKLAEGMFTYSIAPKMFRRRFMFGFEWMGYSSSVQEQGNLKTSLQGYLVEPYAGYVIIQKNNFRLYPFVGINNSFSSLKLQDLSPVTDFDNVWNGTRREATIDFNSFALDLGFHTETLFNIKNRTWDCPQNTNYIALGLTAGYYVNLSESSNGRFNGQRFADSPTFQLNGLYGKLTIGFGTKLRQLKWK
jgi:hypothetical protein